MKKLRTVIFWSHLSVALAVGLVVAVKAATGIALAFEPQLLAWAESPSRWVIPAERTLGADEVLARARGQGEPTALVVSADRLAAVRVTLGRDGGVHVDPYTGEVRPLAGQRWRAFLRLMEEWHRWLGTGEASRPVGKAISGAATMGFLFLTLSGLYLWWPRVWSRAVVRRSLWFRRGLGGKARDWSWHNVIGFWCLPVLIVLSASGLVLSYRWASNLVYTLAGEAPPVPAEVIVPVPPAGAQTLGLESLLSVARREVPGWKTITLRLRDPRRPRPEGARPERARPEGGRRRGEGAQAVQVIVKEASAWPLFATTQLSLDPFTGAILKRDSQAEQTPGRRARGWLRFLHTGEALGWPGRLAAAGASLGALLLVWTGVSLAVRRLRGATGTRRGFRLGSRPTSRPDGEAGASTGPEFTPP